MNGQSGSNSESDDDYLDPVIEGRTPSTMSSRSNKSFTCDRTVPAVPDDETPPPVPDRNKQGRKGGERKAPPPISTHTPDTPVRNQVISPAKRRQPAPLPSDVTPPIPREPQRQRAEEIRTRSDVRRVPPPPVEEDQCNYEVPEDLPPRDTSAKSMESVMLKAMQNGGRRPLPTPGQEERLGRPLPTPGQEVRLGRPLPTPDQEDRLGRPLPTPDQEDQMDDVYEEPNDQIDDMLYEDPDERPGVNNNQRPLPEKPVSSNTPPGPPLRSKQALNTQLLGKKIVSGIDTVAIKNAQSGLRPVLTRFNSEESRQTEPKPVEIKSGGGGVKELAGIFNSKPSPPPKPGVNKRYPAPYAATTVVSPVSSTPPPANTATPVPADRTLKRNKSDVNDYTQDPTTPPTSPQTPEITMAPNPAPRQAGRALPPTPPVTTESTPFIETLLSPSDKKSVTNTPSSGGDRKRLPLPAVPPAQEMEDLHSYDWYFSDLSREKSQSMIMNEHRDGTFMVRKSTHKDNPYTLCLFYQNRHWNLHIRRRQDQKYALGTAKPNEQTFRSVPEIIDCHKKKPIILVGSVGGDALLTRPPPRRSID